MRIVLFSDPRASLELSGDEETVVFTLRSGGYGCQWHMNAAELVHQINLVADTQKQHEPEPEPMTAEESLEHMRIEQQFGRSGL